MMLPTRPLVLALSLILVTACSQQGQPAADAVAPKADPAAADLANYQQLTKMHSDAGALATAKEIVRKYPDSAAAAQVKNDIPTLQGSVDAAQEKARLEGLWLYQKAPMAGGTQQTASLYSSKPAGEDRVRLVLRRHTAWGQSVFLFGSGKGFKCAATCSIPATFDGKPHTLTGYRPATGEPALFIKGDPAFIAALLKTKKITMEVVSADRGKQSLLFEVGGYDADKFPQVSKKK
jgi:hypothetical protein